METFLARMGLAVVICYNKKQNVPGIACKMYYYNWRLSVQDVSTMDYECSA
jgi:hypothetical protein